MLDETINFINMNKGNFWTIITSVITIASIIVKMTPNKKDDAYLVKILKFLSLNSDK